MSKIPELPALPDGTVLSAMRIELGPRKDRFIYGLPEDLEWFKSELIGQQKKSARTSPPAGFDRWTV